jgi:hypothetical protein
MSDVCSVRICSWITHYPELGLDFPMVGLKSFYTGQCLGLGARARLRKAVFFFRSKLTLPEGEGPASRSEL